MTASASHPDGGRRAGRRDASLVAGATPIWISPRARGILVVIGLALLALLGWRAPTLVRLAIGGTLVALVLSFPVQAFSRVMPRGAAIALSLLIVVAVVAFAIGVVVPIAVEQLSAFVAAVPGIAQRLGEQVPSVLDSLARSGVLPDSPERVLEEGRQRLLVAVQEFAGGLLGGLGRFVSGVAGVVVAFLGMVLVGVYLLVDARRIQAAMIRATPHRYRRDGRALWDAFSQTLSRYIGAVLIAITVEGALAAVAFHFLGLPYAVLLGGWVGITALIPYVGAWIGYAPALLLALSISPTRALAALLVCMVINLLVGNVLSPRLQGRAVDVPPSIVFAATVAGGELFGVGGVVLAVPTVATLRVLFDFFRVRLRVADEHAATSPGRTGDVTLSSNGGNDNPTDESRDSHGPFVDGAAFTRRP